MLHLPCYHWSENCNVMLQLPCYHWSENCNVMLHLPCYHWSENCNVMLQLPCYHWSHSPHKSKDCTMPNGQTDTSSSAELHWTQWLGSGTRRTDCKLLTNYQDFYTKTAPTALQSRRISSSWPPHMPSLHTKSHVYCRHPSSFRKTTC